MWLWLYQRKWRTSNPVRVNSGLTLHCLPNQVGHHHRNHKWSRSKGSVADAWAINAAAQRSLVYWPSARSSAYCDSQRPRRLLSDFWPFFLRIIYCCILHVICLVVLRHILKKICTHLVPAGHVQNWDTLRKVPTRVTYDIMPIMLVQVPPKYNPDRQPSMLRVTWSILL